jgi:hypothetical protein
VTNNPLASLRVRTKKERCQGGRPMRKGTPSPECLFFLDQPEDHQDRRSPLRVDEPPKLQAILRTVRLPGFEIQKCNHGIPPRKCTRSPTVVSVACGQASSWEFFTCRPVGDLPTRSDYFGINLYAVNPLRISRATTGAAGDMAPYDCVIPAQTVAKQANCPASTRHVYKICEFRKSA